MYKIPVKLAQNRRPTRSQYLFIFHIDEYRIRFEEQNFFPILYYGGRIHEKYMKNYGQIDQSLHFLLITVAESAMPI